MTPERIDIWRNGEYTYPAAYGFIPNIRAYTHNDNEKRDSILVVPGGAYCMVVPQEGEIVAKDFFARGYDTYVLTYTTDITTAFPLKKQPLKDIARAVRTIRRLKDDKEKKLFVCGFSAGGHLCATLATHYKDVIENDAGLAGFSCRPDAAILAYPVITCKEYTEEFSKRCLLGPEPTDEENNYFSLETQVTEDTVPCFVWTTFTDNLVNYRNACMFADALRDKGIMCEQHVFSHGDHGLCIATEDFFEGRFGEEYTFEQVNRAVKALKEGRSINVSERRQAELREQFADDRPAPVVPKTDPKKFADVAQWVELADLFMKRIM
ncbi:MAG: alpha/beta hydrolase [Lachnospiraceae bacterium]|nr:alpha/beta hydrolase [Lachnospiraceae bacterium]